MHLIRHAEDRGHTTTDWLNSRHSFSFGTYKDPNWDGFRTLTVINEDHVAPQSGFEPHSHKNMEIMTYVVSGTLTHQDSTGAKSTMKSGDAQLMSAGVGIEHSEMNETDEPCHFLQIWIKPDQQDEAPKYQQISVEREEKEGNIKLLASPEGSDNSLQIAQNVYIYNSLVIEGESISINMEPERHVWIQIISGSTSINGENLHAGDGISISAEEMIVITAVESNADLLLFDLG